MAARRPVTVPGAFPTPEACANWFVPIALNINSVLGQMLGGVAAPDVDQHRARLVDQLSDHGLDMEDPSVVAIVVATLAAVGSETVHVTRELTLSNQAALASAMGGLSIAAAERWRLLHDGVPR